MRRIISATFISMDGIMQAPGGPTEDPVNGFTLGGWTATYWDEVMGKVMGENFMKPFDLLLGRKTYEIFEAYWPRQSEDNPIARTLNAAKKHVASRTLKSLQWNNSSLLGGDIVAAITALKGQSGHDLQIIGSGNLIQTLQAASLIDEYNVWTYPVVLGHGKRLFENGARPCALRLVASKVATTGVVMCTYVPAGEIKLGTIGQG